METLERQIDKKKDEFIIYLLKYAGRSMRIDQFKKELFELKSRYKEAQCHAIIEKVREANTPDKRSFEEAEAESRMSEEQNIIKALSGEKIPEVQTITSTDYKEPDGAEEWFDKNSINYKGVRSRHHAIQMLNDFARQSLKGELINFLRENNWLNLEDEANAIRVVESYLKVYGKAQPSDENRDEFHVWVIPVKNEIFVEDRGGGYPVGATEHITFDTWEGAFKLGQFLAKFCNYNLERDNEAGRFAEQNKETD